MEMRIATIAASVAAAYASRAGLLLGALALTVEKEAHAKLPDAVKALYIEKDGQFTLDVDGIEDSTALRRQLKKVNDESAARRNELKALQEKYEGIDPEEVRARMIQADDNEETKLIKSGKWEEVLAKRNAKRDAETAKQRKKLEDDLAAERASKTKWMEKVLDGVVQRAAAKVGIHTHAIEDAIIRARRIFVPNDDGEAVQLDSGGKVIVGKDGKTPFGPVEWLEGMKETAPHWFPASNTGSGAGGDKGGKGGKKTMKRSEFDSLGQIERAAVGAQAAKGEVQIVD
jgi:hypothetical protein